MLTAGVVGVSIAASWVAPILSPLLVSVLIGFLLVNFRLIPEWAVTGVHWMTKPALRLGVVFLGLQLSLQQVLALSIAECVTIAFTVVITFFGTRWLGRTIGVNRELSILVATGFAICGASAIAAMSAVLPPDEKTERDTAAAVALVTVYGSVAMVVLPLLSIPLALTDRQAGLWIGASVHEVAQVVAAAAAVSGVALATAVVVKLGRVVLLAPLVASIGLLERRRTLRNSTSQISPPPVVPVFVVGFLLMITVRSTGLVPDAVLDGAKWVTTCLLAAAMFGLGASLRAADLRSSGLRVMLLGALSTLIAMGVSLGGILIWH